MKRKQVVQPNTGSSKSQNQLSTVPSEAKNISSWAFGPPFECSSGSSGNSDLQGASDLAAQPSMVGEAHIDSDVFCRYSQLCAWNVNLRCSAISCNSKANASSDSFNRYSQICERNVKPWCSPDLLEPTDVGIFRIKSHIVSDVFVKYSDLCATNVAPPLTAAEDYAGVDASLSNHMKRTHCEARPILSVGREASSLRSIISESVAFVILVTGDSIHVGTSGSTHRKRTFEGVRPIENTPFKRIHASTAIARDTQSHRVKMASRGGCSASNSQGPLSGMGNVSKDTKQLNTIYAVREGKSIWHLNLIHLTKIDDSINRGRGLYVFKVSGQIYHWIGSMCPPMGATPKLLQSYIYDTDNEVANRMRHFGGVNDSSLDPDIVQGLIHFLNAHNELGACGYELSASNTLGAIDFYSRPTGNTDFDVIIQEKDGPTQRVSKLHPSYMALQFPLLVIPRQGGNVRRNKIGTITTHWCQQ
ncbi:hypothetical protein Tco_0692474 [Tanacetum coccineum]